VVAAAVMVMPRSRSCGIQSICASPSCTSPILWMRPAKNRNRSLTVGLARVDVSDDADVARSCQLRGLGWFCFRGGGHEGGEL
jgi:hypothetical protein